MENKKQGYKVRKYQGPVKRYCQMLNLKNDAALIAEYRKRHSEGKVWPCLLYTSPSPRDS